MSMATIFFASSTAVFAILWIIALTGSRRRTEKHLQAIMFALDFRAGSWAKGRSFLRCYVEGRHDIIQSDFPHFADFCEREKCEI